MITFLAFVLSRHLARQGAYWRCPHCDRRNPSVVCNKPKAGCKDKWRCVQCMAWGDEYDLLRHFHPAKRFPELRFVVAELRREWEAKHASRHERRGNGRRPEQLLAAVRRTCITPHAVLGGA